HRLVDVAALRREAAQPQPRALDEQLCDRLGWRRLRRVPELRRDAARELHALGKVAAAQKVFGGASLEIEADVTGGAFSGFAIGKRGAARVTAAGERVGMRASERGLGRRGQCQRL